MLAKLGRRGYAIGEKPGESRLSRNDPNSDTDPDTGGSAEPGDGHPGAAADAATPRR
jgi:hypothetical protein